MCPLLYTSSKEITYDGKTKTAWVGKKEGTFKYLSDLSYARTDKEAVFFHFNEWEGVGLTPYKYSGNFTIAENIYLHGIGLENDAVSSNEGRGSIEYYLSGKYKKITGFIGIDDYAKDSGNPGVIKFIADGKEIYSSPKMMGGDLPREINLDLSGTLKLKIEFITSGADYKSNTLIDFVEAKLFQ